MNWDSCCTHFLTRKFADFYMLAEGNQAMVVRVEKSWKSIQTSQTWTRFRRSSVFFHTISNPWQHGKCEIYVDHRIAPLPHKKKWLDVINMLIQTYYPRRHGNLTIKKKKRNSWTIVFYIYDIYLGCISIQVDTSPLQENRWTKQMRKIAYFFAWIQPTGLFRIRLEEIASTK